MIDDIIGVILWTDNLESMVGFYRDVMELPLHSHHGDFATFELRPGMRLSIGLHDRVRGPSTEPFRVMVNLSVQDIHAAHETLTERGESFIREPEQEGWGGWIATLHDPDGNTLQLMQMP